MKGNIKYLQSKISTLLQKFIDKIGEELLGNMSLTVNKRNQVTSTEHFA
jgi:hypothetical protein